MQDFSSIPTRDLYDRYILPTYGRFDLTLARGAGSYVWDEDGTQYLDFGGGIAVCSLGHSHPEVTRAVAVQAASLVHTSNLYYTRLQAELAGHLVEKTGAGRVFFCNSGAEANEGLIKLSRRFGNATGGRHEVITFQGSFHGRTMAGISATGQDKVKVGFAPLLEGFVHVPFGDLEAVAAAITEDTAAILVEPVQGEGGVHVASAEFLQGLRMLCDKYDLLLLFDEIQCGLGRVGEWCAWKAIADESVIPDGVSWAKGIANGFPLGAFWIREKKISDGSLLPSLLGVGSHGTTYGGNPVSCAAALAVHEIIEKEDLLTNGKEMGAILQKKICDLHSSHIHEVRGLGLMIGVELTPEFGKALSEETTPATTSAMAFCREARLARLLVIPAGENVIRLLPPLNITQREVEEAVEKIATVLNVAKKD